MSGNLLGGETSPYLLQHKDNPVHWMAWGDDALGRARREDKPILLSIGYAACHWCHVMAHESFENPETAGVMNDLFINIKLDREERPDLDAIYQAALSMLGEQGGWPLTMFLTPQIEPFWGGTYFPPEPRYGRPGFRDVLRGVADVYRSDPTRVRHNADALRKGLEEMARPKPGGAISIGDLDQVSARLIDHVDLVFGGLQGAPKFPQSSAFQLLWRAWKRTGEARYRDAVAVTLTQICQGGIYDHLGGGFARYSVDNRWLAPHFEKMLYDNAQLVELLTLVWQDTRDPVYAARVRETIDWLLREMTQPEGGFSSSLDADSEGVEGKFYVWSLDEIAALLGDNAAEFARYYDVSTHGNWEGTNILNRLETPAPADSEAEARLALSRDILLRTRADRIHPGKDDKVLADWNGLMIAALAFAGTAFGRRDWIDAAAAAFGFVCDTMTENGRLRHSWRAGKLNQPATLDDYANMARAALLLFEATGEQACVDRAEAWVAVVDRHYADSDGAGGYFFAADDTPDLLVRNKVATDSPMPSGNGVMVEVLTRLWLTTGKETCRESADRAVAAFSGEVARNFLPLATLLNAFEMRVSPVQIVLIGEPDRADTRALAEAVFDISLPGRIFQPLAPGAVAPAGHPAAGKGQVGDAATLYICRGQTCSLPITDPGSVTVALRPPEAA